MAKIRIGENLEARIELPKKEAPVVIQEPQIIEKVVQVTEFDYAKIAPYIKELHDKIDVVQQMVVNVSNPVTQVIEKKEILPVETKVVNIVTHDKEDVERIDNEIKYIYDELKSDITSIIESHKSPQITVVDTSEEINKLNIKIDKLNKQNKYLLYGVVAITIILNLL